MPGRILGEGGVYAICANKTLLCLGKEAGISTDEPFPEFRKTSLQIEPRGLHAEEVVLQAFECGLTFWAFRRIGGHSPHGGRQRLLGMHLSQ